MSSISNKSEFGYVSYSAGVVTIRIGENEGVVSLDFNSVESVAVLVNAQQEVCLLLYFKAYASTTVLALTHQCALGSRLAVGQMLEACQVP